MRNLGIWIFLGVVVLLIFWGISMYNGLIGLNEDVSTQWSNVENAYQLRADKTQNLVAIVKGAADFEKETLTGVIEARAKATSVQLNADQLTPDNLKAFEQAQEQFTGALSRLMVTVERYPELKAVQGFRDFQVQYEGMENRIGVERREYNDTARSFNTRIKSFPGNLFAGSMGLSEKGYFEAKAGADVAPQVAF